MHARMINESGCTLAAGSAAEGERSSTALGAEPDGRAVSEGTYPVIWTYEPG